MRTQAHKVLITGGAKGIGLGLARRFYHAGNTVILVGRDASALAQAAATLPGCLIEVADIARPDDRKRLIDKIKSEHPDLSVLINNAGTQFNGPFADIAADQIDTELQTNLLAPLHLIHALLPALHAQPEAAVVNVSSVLAWMPKQSAATYCASKAALHSFSTTLRWQLEGSKVRVFDVIPPLVDTAMTAGRGSGKISPDQLADIFWQHWQSNRERVPVGKARIIQALMRLAPSVAERILRRG